jgi:hypothetical protein
MMGVAEQPETLKAVDIGACRFEVSRRLERHPVPSRNGDVDEPVVRRSEIEVDDGDRRTVANDDILDTEVVVAHDVAGLW